MFPPFPPRQKQPAVDVRELDNLTKMYADGHLSVPGAGGAAVPAPFNALVGQFTPSAHLNDRIVVWRGDITRLKVDGIVNAANKSLLGGGGVDGAIHAAAGSQLREECWRLHGCDTGDCKITKGYRLPAKHVLHTVGPIYHDGDFAEAQAKLVSCYERCIMRAVENNVRSVAFCAISTGIYGYPSNEAAIDAARTVRRLLEDAKYAGKLDRVVFVTFVQNDVQAYDTVLPLVFPPVPEDEASSAAAAAGKDTAAPADATPTVPPSESSAPRQDA
ncbi:O-acetyl-ADP-ribose deacetylase macrod2 [Sporothrix curviconia]|uniref:O-acetyl-ADP-ribose deacetylase macrod2 n=1 Tax=Sporothrix curviconia TaxID=1260050 RepID=A0ABP0C6B3_9PEZI